MLAAIASLGLGFAADKVLSTAAKAVLPVAKTTGERIIQKAGCLAISAGIGYAIDKMISDTAKDISDTARDISKALDTAMGIEIIEKEEAE